MKKVVENYGAGYLHSIVGAAVRLGVSKDTLNNFIAEGLILPIRFPKAKRLRIAEWQLEECSRKLINRSSGNIVSARVALDGLKLKVVNGRG